MKGWGGLHVNCGNTACDEEAYLFFMSIPFFVFKGLVMLTNFERIQFYIFKQKMYIFNISKTNRNNKKGLKS